jgi:hypothetical protein
MPSAKIIADFYEIFPTISACLNNEKTFSGQFFKMSRFRDTVVAFFDHLALRTTFDQNIKSLIFSGVKIFLANFFV